MRKRAPPAQGRLMDTETQDDRVPHIETPQYEQIFEDRAVEQERLRAQAAIFDPLTRRVLREAGLCAGMRVLDLGSGAGNVALLAAELVGPEGTVVGIERDASAVEDVRRSLAVTGPANIDLRQGDVQTLDGVEGGFDAVIGRLVLMYLSDPAEALRQAAARARPGAVICMHEADMTYPWASPSTALWQQIHGWFLDTLAWAGVEQRMGPSLFATFRAAGLPDPHMQLSSFADGGSQAPAWGFANVILGLVPLMQRLGIATRDQVDPETLADRLLADVVANDGILTVPMFGAWTNVPSA
jgi:ubiquinone/menaquinone biosynthesis C-methylase UbiE